MLSISRSFIFAGLFLLASSALPAQTIEYKLIATNKTSTTEKELNQAAQEGFRFAATMGGETSFGGSQVVTVMSRKAGDRKGRFSYKLLATMKTSTMQKELQAASDEGYDYKGQTVYQSAFGGREVVIILELDRSIVQRTPFEFKLLATMKTSTMEKELTEAGAQGFDFVGVTVGETSFGGHEVVAILRRPRQ